MLKLKFVVCFVYFLNHDIFSLPSYNPSDHNKSIIRCVLNVGKQSSKQRMTCKIDNQNVYFFRLYLNVNIENSATLVNKIVIKESFDICNKQECNICQFTEKPFCCLKCIEFYIGESKRSARKIILEQNRSEYKFQSTGPVIGPEVKLNSISLNFVINYTK
ncbi:hypothetical protein BpHYR1_029575 [Brachionus plicatilis]|uniref:Uncharacterized protein n=1 Tax=Brachionus plicatilis TaxID=10195 RepID=A0A3M7S4Z2_BRAPC|nr:hypothetical protein BpHYR1_029575 [Brachionus plicatilis]